MQFEADFSDYAESTFRADHQSGQVITCGCFFGTARRSHYLAIGHHRGQGQHILPHGAIAHSVGAGCASCGHSAKRSIRSRVNGKEKSLIADIFIELLAGDARLYGNVKILRVYFKHPVHVVHVQRHTAIGAGYVALQRRSCTEGNDRHFVFGTNLHHLLNLFGLLALLHPPEHIWAAHRNLTTAGSRTRGHALEYLDNTLSGETRRAVLTALEAQPLGDKLRRAREIFGTQRRQYAEVFGHYLGRPACGDADACFLTAAALHGICTERLSTLYPEVRRLADESGDQFVQETARWARERIGDGAV